jgi:RHS repeat-associated protein
MVMTERIGCEPFQARGAVLSLWTLKATSHRFHNKAGRREMKNLRFWFFAVFVAAATVCVGQDLGTQPSNIKSRISFGPSTLDTNLSLSTSYSLPSQTDPDFAADPTADIIAMARGLENDPKRIYDYVHDHIRYDHYFGSKKGAALTLIEESGNDFDQAALLVSLLRCAGYTNLTYQYGYVIMPYDSSDHRDFKHWVGATMVNNKWYDTNDTANSTLQFISTLNYNRGWPVTYDWDGTNRCVFDHIWVKLTMGGTNYLLDPSFKVTEPVSGISMDSAMGLNTNTFLSTAMGGASGTADYVLNLNESGIRGKLRDYTTNLLAWLQANAPNASVEDILGGREIVSTVSQPLGAALPYQIYSYTDWPSISTSAMAQMKLQFANTNQYFYLPELQGERLSLTYDSNGVAQLWYGDSLVLTEPATGSSTETVYLSVYYPFSQINDVNWSATYQRTNATYNLMYCFDPSPNWLRKRQEQLDTYRSQGFADNSRQVQSETLNVMGLSWFTQTDLMHRALCIQNNVMKVSLHRMGRMGQVAGQGYFVDAFLQHDASFSAAGLNATFSAQEDQVSDLVGYFRSAAEHGVIEQMESTNAPAASTMKLLEIGNTNAQKTFLASAANWSTVSSQISNYNTSFLYNNYIANGYYLLLPQNGNLFIAGTGSWHGSGLLEILIGSGYRFTRFDIGGGYSGGYSGYPGLTTDPAFISQSDSQQADYFHHGNPALPDTTKGDPVRMLDGALQINSTDLTLGQREPRGITFTRFYSPTRRHVNQASLGNGWTHSYNISAAQVSASLPGLGTTTPAQMAPILAATRAALAIYPTSPNVTNWLTAALIAKWGMDQLINNGVSITLGNDAVQFVQQPDGSFTPPASCTMALSQSGSTYTLQERHGNTFTFTANALTSITDPYNNSLSLNYSNGLVSTVTDWKGRALTFNYGGSPQRLTSVSDGTRSVSFGYSSGDLTSVTDPESKTRTLAYDTNHQVTAIFDAVNRLVVTNIYDSFGRVITQYTRGDTNQAWQYFWAGFVNTMQDPAGNRQRFYYDDKKRLIAEQDALGNIGETFYDGQDHPVMTISPLNETNQFVYDGNHNLIQSIDPLGFTNQFGYDNQNNFTQLIDARGNTSHFGYNAQFSLTGATNGAGDYINYHYNADGTLQTRTDSAGTITNDYDAYGQLNRIAYPNGLGTESFINSAFGDVTSHTDARNFTTTLQYNNRRQLTNVVAPTNLTIQVSYDAVGNVYTTTDARNFSTTNTWSATRRLLATIFPATPQGVPVVTNIYDNRDWLSQSFDPLQNRTQFTNDAAHRLISITDPLQRTKAFAYDYDGRRLAAINAALETNSQTWDANGRVRTASDGAGHTSSRGYDQAGNQILLTNRNSKVWQFQFDRANRVTNTVSPLNKQWSRTFNDRGLISNTQDANTQSTSFYYDAKKRLTNRTDNIATTLFGYDANDNPTSVIENGYTNSWTYDAYNRVSSYRDINGNLIQYRYDGNGNLTNLVYPGGRTVTYFYDSLNRLTNITDWATRVTTIGYDLDGRPRTITRPNGTSRTVDYDAAGQATNIVEKLPSGLPIALFRLNWNNAAEIQWEFAAPTNHPTSLQTRNMTYDDDNRLATVNGISTSRDGNGNLTYGPLTNAAFSTHVYDARNRLVSAGGVTNFYDAADTRIAQTVGASTTTFVVNPNAHVPQVLMRIKGSVTNYYIYGAGLVYQVTETATTTNTVTYHYDFRGSTVALTDGNGLITDRIEYSAYGSLTYRIGSTDTPFLFNGRYGVMTDPNGLLYMRARYYNPYICRFMNADPSGFAGGLNLYAFANGNPISLIDPFGLGSNEPWYDQWGNYIHSSFQASKSDRDNNAPGPWWLNGAADTLDDILSGLLSTPQALGHIGTGTGKFSADPTLANSAGVFQDISLAASTVIPVAGIVDRSLATVATTASDTVIANPVPSTLARVIPNGINATTLGAPSAADVFVTDAAQLEGLNAQQIAAKLTIPESPSGFQVIEFPTPQRGLASPVFRSNPGFVGGGQTAGGASEFVIPNGPIPAGAVIKTVP